MDFRLPMLGCLSCALAACFNPDGDDVTDTDGTGSTGATNTQGDSGPGVGPDTGDSTSSGNDDTTGSATTAGTTLGSGTTVGADDTTGDDTTDADSTSTGSAEGWQARRQLTFDNSVLDAGLTDFPVLVVLNRGRVEYDLMQPDGADLRFYDRNEAPLPYEIESWDPAGDSFVWVRISEIDANDDHFFMDYGNSAADDAQDAPAVWEGAYEAVWHLADDPSMGVATDSTGNGHDGTLPKGSDAASVAARVGPGMVMDGNDAITVPDAPGLDLVDRVTLEAWASPTSLAAPAIGIVERSFYYSLEAVRFAGNPAGMGIRTGGLTQSVGLDSDLALNSWTHLAGSYEASDGIRLVVDGTLSNSTEVGAAAIPDNSVDITIGGGFSGTLDEIRIVGVEHNQAWLSAQHESMTDELLSFGPVTDPPAA